MVDNKDLRSFLVVLGIVSALIGATALGINLYLSLNSE